MVMVNDPTLLCKQTTQCLTGTWPLAATL